MQLALAIKTAPRTFICGNGGSAANAIHIANDLIACGVRAHALTGDIATLTCIANDFSYEEIFAKQLRILADEDDLLLVLSGSGNSVNILRALLEARKMQMKTWAIIGNLNPVGKAASMAEHVLKKGSTIQLAEEAQLAFGHEIARWLKRNS